MKTRHCDECAHGNQVHLAETACNKGHRPRFFLPRNSLDRDWGFKRECADYESLIERKREMA